MSLADRLNEKSPETKAQKFQRLAELRVSNILEDIRILSHLHNVGNYEYTPAQVNKMKEVLYAAFEKTFDKFEGDNTAFNTLFQF